jgi:hypothetical protein
MQRAASFRCLNGFDDAAARAQTWHSFTVRRTWRVQRFLRDIEQLVIDRRIAVEVDGVLVRLKGTAAA